MAIAHGKKYRESLKQIDKAKRYAPKEAVALAKKTSSAKFDAGVQLHMTLGADPKQADQQVRGTASLPHGLGKTIRVMAFVGGELVRAAKDAGADHIGDDETIAKIEGGWSDFEVAIATPDMMTKVAKLGRVLGRKGLMPNAKSGTVVQPQDIAKAIGEAKRGRVEFRLDRSGAIHAVIGKVSFDEQKLLDNMGAVMEAVMQAKPAAIKGVYVTRASLNANMAPAIRLDIPALTSLKAK
ncbi:MAG: 50S ribosomal protein L1 [Chloroflexi bacterium]|nr:50S ribosomal protein L1 [Chloroflexota bacterium]